MPIPFSMFILAETPSLTNQREHWSVRKRRAALHRALVRACWVQIGKPKMEFPVEVILTRVSPRPLDDDNLRGALKHIRDGLAEEMGIDDRDPRVTWRYDQDKGKPTGVRVQIGEVSTVCSKCGQKIGAAA